MGGLFSVWVIDAFFQKRKRKRNIKREAEKEKKRMRKKKKGRNASAASFPWLRSSITLSKLGVGGDTGKCGMLYGRWLLVVWEKRGGRRRNVVWGKSILTDNF